MKFPDEVVAEAERTASHSLSATAMTLCVSCYSRLPLGGKFYTVIVNHHIRRACVACFASKPELKQAWVR